MVRGTVVLPHGTGKRVRVIVFAQGEKAQEALRGGADEVGGEDLAKKIEAGWLDFDIALATPDMMGIVGRLGRILGRRGLMPNPKSGTITFDVERAIREVKAGRVEFKVDKAGIIHTSFGKASFEPQQLSENLAALLDAINRARPSVAEGSLLQEPDGGHPRWARASGSTCQRFSPQPPPSREPVNRLENRRQFRRRQRCVRGLQGSPAASVCRKDGDNRRTQRTGPEWPGDVDGHAEAREVRQGLAAHRDAADAAPRRPRAEPSEDVAGAARRSRKRRHHADGGQAGHGRQR